MYLQQQEYLQHERKIARIRPDNIANICKMRRKLKALLEQLLSQIWMPKKTFWQITDNDISVVYNYVIATLTTINCCLKREEPCISCAYECKYFKQSMGTFPHQRTPTLSVVYSTLILQRSLLLFQRRIQESYKHLKWRTLQQYLTVFIH